MVDTFFGKNPSLVRASERGDDMRLMWIYGAWNRIHPTSTRKHAILFVMKVGIPAKVFRYRTILQDTAMLRVRVLISMEMSR